MEIEVCDPSEIGGDSATAAGNDAVDITPVDLATGIVTDEWVIHGKSLG